MVAMNYDKLKNARVRERGKREALADSEARATIRQVVRHRPSVAEQKRSKELARDAVFNYEGTDPYLLGLQASHGEDVDWLPTPSVASAVLTIVCPDEQAGFRAQDYIEPPAIALPTADERAVRREAEEWVRRYAGNNKFVLSVQAELRKPGVRYLTDPRLATVAVIREEERSGTRAPRPLRKAPIKPKVNRGGQRGQKKQREQDAYNSSKRIIRRPGRTSG